ncbi:S-adenosyl-l-methionine hydroxide adenosyltransferase [Fulvivirga sp. RKSG066]|uniref:SAM hydrolase/SAM-dependent halogenase family protein n=1 Tax=Fulvivirga aurantia TaxID=2529383 RepID=UPI0012BB6ECE|nr:SAM-dependent chlorinase/fluorinase [Fulvivirga aurantia]MTI19715.1 S-adenosyl-l-methionine hydroxide adenosyltransferase [Fulvivirga aurantia]
MAIITFLSDFGESDHYVAAVKAKILAQAPEATIIDISHQINSCDIAHAAYVLKAVYRDFPKGSIHIVAVNSVGQPGDEFIAVQLDGHFFIGTDNGLLGLVSDSQAENQVAIGNGQNTSFPAKQIFAEAAGKLATGTPINDLGKSIPHFKKSLGRHLKANKSLISGHVIRVDHYGNLITNIDKTTFDILSKQKTYNITFGRENGRRISDNINTVDAGDIFIIFNDQGYLEIGINQGNACELLGLGYDSPVMIKFDE